MVGRRSSWNLTLAGAALAGCLAVTMTVGCGRSSTEDAISGRPSGPSVPHTQTIDAGSPAAPNQAPPVAQGAAADQDPPGPPAGDDPSHVGPPDTRDQTVRGEPPTPTDAPRDAVEPGRAGEFARSGEVAQPARFAADGLPGDSQTQSGSAASTASGVAVLNWVTWTPHVDMSQSHAATGLVAVGDTMPNYRLGDVEGTSHQLKELLAEHLTVVVFWNSRYAYAREQYELLAREIIQPYGDLGVKVVAINVGDDAETIRALGSVSDDRIVSLLDPQQTAYQSVATERLPRTYLLDPSGKVLWMDIEYSRGMRRQLENAVRHFLTVES